ncbi:MAG: hypothetical protein DRJ50_02000 [Actinobacteria bacterium]|nr:MAG: hypothetical protein DRJ50_02000 [Actinomycetota bacterium]
MLLLTGATAPAVLAQDYCTLLLVGTEITDAGDGDGFADTNETLQIGISLQPRCSDPATEGLSDCVAWLSTESPAIDCLRKMEILVGDLPTPGPAVTPVERFEIKIGAVDRHDLGLGPDDSLEASLTIDVHCMNGASLLSISERLVLPLDLNVSDLGQTPIGWEEGFEGCGNDPGDPLQGTAFFAANIDAGLPGNNNSEGLSNSDGWRCQYSDPDWANAASYNHSSGEICYPGSFLSHANAIFWQVDGSTISDSPDGGRAFRGEKSMYYGIFLGAANENFTTPLSPVESVAMIDPINLGVNNPQLSFWQQISLADSRAVGGSRVLRNVDRGVVQIQLYDPAGNQISPWMNLTPLQNTYDQQAEDNFYNCTFDPIDDGNTEDDFFDPSDPSRKHGPSSTCYPNFSWAFLGSTTGTYAAGNVGNATTPPALGDVPAMGWGTWIESKIDLAEFRGRRAKLRYLVSSITTGYTENYYLQFGSGNNEEDDGWWIDEIAVDETLPDPAVFTNDRFLLGSCTGSGVPCIGQCRSSLAPCSDATPCTEGEGDCVMPCAPGETCSGLPPGCDVGCTQAWANAFVEPEGPLNPVTVVMSETDDPLTVNLAAPFDVETGAEPSTLDACIDGFREYRFCISGDPDGTGSGLPDADCDDAWDRPVCDSCSSDWSLASQALLSPAVVTTYAMQVRCSSAPECGDGRTLQIDVECASGNSNATGLRQVRALDRQTLTWHGPLNVDWVRGSFSSSAEIGNYVADFTDVAAIATSIPMDGDPPAGTGYYYLVKKDGAPPFFQINRCDTATWRSGGDAEQNEPARNNVFGNP